MGDTLVRGIEELGAFASDLAWNEVPADVRDRLELVLLDTLGVLLAGAATAECGALVAATDPPHGPARIFGHGRDTSVDHAAFLNGFALCSLELDEGNKYARGHPAAHVVPAAIAVGQQLRVSGEELLAAILVGYEVAARFGQATVLHPGVHPHGNWGATGAAAACARLLGLARFDVAGAIDAAGGLALATPFETALAGNHVRNSWVGSANCSGMWAARLAAAGLAGTHGTAGWTLGRILGELDPEVLGAGVGERWAVTRGYFKRHASCAYTHPPADAAIELRHANPALDPQRISSLTVETHRLAASLDRTDTPTRLAAMFSIPHVVAVTLLYGDCLPRRSDEDHRSDPAVRRLAASTTVVRSDEFDARLPDHRGARLVARLDEGTELVAEVGDPVGDADHRPFGRAEVREKLANLLDPVTVERVAVGVEDLAEASDVNEVLTRLP